MSSRQPNLYLTLNLIPWKTRCKGTAFFYTHQIFCHKNMFYNMFFSFLSSQFNKNAWNSTFFCQKFGHIKKKQYLCTRFRKGSDFEIQIGAVVQLVRIHACHAWGREFESRPHRKRSNLRVAFFCVLWLFTRLRGLIFNVQNSARARNNNIIITEKSFRYVIVIFR